MKQIRVLQIIDSLDAGGSEMVAVNIANQLAKSDHATSYLLSSRAGGMLRNRIHPSVHYTSLNKKSSFDLIALWRMFRLLKKEQIDIVHCHSTSFYLPILLKPFCHFKLVWHDHYGLALNLETGKRDTPIKPFARHFDFTFVVNKQLLEVDTRLFKIPAEKIMYLPNFSTAAKPALGEGDDPPILKGNKNDRVVCLANLRPQKDHLNLLEAFRIVLSKRPASYLYLVGMDTNDGWVPVILDTINKYGMQENVMWLGGKEYPMEILEQCAIGVLSSESEGLPLAVIEYGMSGLAVVSTAVGEVPKMLTDGRNAFLVAPKNADALACALLKLLNNNTLSVDMGIKLAKLVEEEYSANVVMEKIISVYKNISDKNA